MLRRLSWQQLTHDKLRLLAAAMGITFAVLLQLMQFGFRDALYTSSVVLHNHLLADLVMLSPQYQYIVSTGRFPRRRLTQALMLKDVDTVASLQVGVVPFKDSLGHQDRQALILAFVPDEAVFDLASMNTHADKFSVADTAIFDARSRAEYRPLIDAVRHDGAIRADIAGRRIEIVGLFDLGVSFTSSPHMITSDSTFRRITNRSEGTTSIGLVRLKAGSNAEAVKAALAAALPPDVTIITREQFVQLERAYWNRSQPIGFIFNLSMYVGLLVGAVIVYQILYTDVNNHLPEYATLKAMGYRDRDLSLIVLQQALILSVIGFPVGFVLAQGLYAIARQATSLPMTMTIARATIVLGLTVGMCAGSGLLAMRRLKSADPADAF